MTSDRSKGVGTVSDYPFEKPDILINIVDCRAKRTPRALYAEFPVSATTYEEGYKKITYEDFANAVNGAAWWLEKTLGRSENFDTLAYIGPNDLRYNVLILGAIKAGYKVSPMLDTKETAESAHPGLNIRCCSHHLAIAFQLMSIFSTF